MVLKVVLTPSVCIRNLILRSVFRANDAPRYVKAFVAHIIVYGVQLVAIVFLRIRLMRLNVLKRRAQALDPTKTSGEDSVGSKSLGFMPLCINWYHLE